MILIILSILWGWSITSDGHAIQIGEILTNNQNIKIMKMNFNNPAWLQAAGNAQEKEYISFVDATGNPQIYQLSAIGDVTIQSIYNGEPTSQTVSNPTNIEVTIQSDANTEVVLYGKITKLYCDRGPGFYTDFTNIDVSHAKSLTNLICSSNQLTSLDVSANTALTDLNCGGNQLTSLDVSTNTALTNLICSGNQLTSLDVSANTALTDLNCYGNQLTSLDVSANIALTSLNCLENKTLQTIAGIGVNEYVANGIAAAITEATSVDGTVTLRQGDEFNQTIIDAATTKGWTVEYVDA